MECGNHSTFIILILIFCSPHLKHCKRYNPVQIERYNCIWSSKWSKFEILDNFLILFDYFPPCTKYIVLIYPCNLNATKMTMLYCEACQWVSSLQLYSCHPLCVAIRYLIEFWNAIVNNWMKFKKCISLLSEKFLLMWSCEAVEDLSGRTL